MAVQPAALLVENGGWLDRKVIWPDLSERAVLRRIEAYLADADSQTGFSSLETDAVKDRTRTYWGYYRSKAEQVDRLTGDPASVDDKDEASGSYLATQINLVVAERDRWKALFDAEIEAVTTPAVANPQPIARSSVSSALGLRW
ncbi:MAG TPA: hypothetical protein VEB59_06905 [Gemmatimonadales bacterium]|nr:hypothetical protein [Gemmatimonadales bacterium]